MGSCRGATEEEVAVKRERMMEASDVDGSEGR
jgi:hypothetical protein